MNEPTLITGDSEEQITQSLTAHLQRQPEAFQHIIALQQQDRRILLEVDIDPGGGFERGYASTRFSAPVAGTTDFAFTIHPEGFLADMAKLFGLQDEVVGYPEFDEKVIIKTNNKEGVRTVFANQALRKTFSALSNFNLRLGRNNEGEKYLTLEIEEGITDPAVLMQLYTAFTQVLSAVDSTNA